MANSEPGPSEEEDVIGARASLDVSAPPKMKNARSEPAVTFEEPTSMSTSSRAGPSSHLLHRSSTETRASLISATKPRDDEDEKGSPAKNRDRAA
ncbi:hypothetical protein GLOTRDRAFT_112266, partial [Gloeophyllum trabeum ATCC 11539]